LTVGAARDIIQCEGNQHAGPEKAVPQGTIGFIDTKDWSPRG
jgi:hypothetical protein